MGNYHARCGAGEKPEVATPEAYLSLFGKIPNFNEVLASVRSREISIKIILQAINQLKSLYKTDWETIFNNCASLLFLGTNDKDTMNYFSMRAGKQTINQKNYSESRGRQRSSSISEQTRQRDLMTPDEIARIGVDEALFFLSKQNVLKDKKFDVNDHKQAKLLSDSPQDGNWYTYRRYMNDIEEWFENVDQTQIIDITQDVMAA
ncbi:TraM recognition domain-containing protein [Streptococcus equi subsp. zooepidemicus]|nr:TraM recognition domain-containing protein [Streptococcus equi subsp. zooepidemicus]